MVGAAKNTVDKPTDDEFEESKLPEKVATAFRAMYAHGMHLRIKSVEDDKQTYESGVAAFVWWQNRGRAVHRVGQFETVDFFG